VAKRILAVLALAVALSLCAALPALAGGATTSIHGRVYYELNGNRTYDEGAWPTGAATVTLSRPDGTGAITTIATPQPYGPPEFRFDGLKPGAYDLSVDVATYCFTDWVYGDGGGYEINFALVSYPVTPNPLRLVLHPGADWAEDMGFGYEYRQW